MSDKIPGGFVLFPRNFYNSIISLKQPCTRETWLYLLARANHSDTARYGRNLKRGQILITYKEIVDSLRWYVGNSERRYSRSQVERAVNILRDNGSLVKQKHPHKMLITIVNYNKYQCPSNYENVPNVVPNRVAHNEGTLTVCRTIDKNVRMKERKQTDRQLVKKLYKDEKLEKSVLDYFNSFLKTGYSRFSNVASMYLNERIEEGINLEQIKKVIKSQYERNNPNKIENFKPEITFSKNVFYQLIESVCDIRFKENQYSESLCSVVANIVGFEPEDIKGDENKFKLWKETVERVKKERGIN